jgi:hypothetical protein
MNKWQIICPVVAIVLVAFFGGTWQGRREARYYVLAQTRMIGEELSRGTNSPRLGALDPALQARLSGFLTPQRGVAEVLLGDQRAPLGDGTACSLLVLSNGVGARLGIRLYQDAGPERFHVLGYWTIIVMEDIPLSCAISNLAQQANLNYILDPRASSASIGPGKWTMPQRSVTCRWTNVAPEVALKQVLREHSLRMVTNAATSVIRIVPLAQFSEPIPASEVGNETNSVIPVVLLGYVPLRVVIDELGRKAGLEISVDPELPIPTSGPPELTIGTSIVSVYWENIRPRQALFALLDACDLAITEHPEASAATIITKKHGLGGRRQPQRSNGQ